MDSAIKWVKENRFLTAGGFVALLGITGYAVARQTIKKSYIVSGNISTSAKSAYDYLKDPVNWYKHVPTPGYDPKVSSQEGNTIKYTLYHNTSRGTWITPIVRDLYPSQLEIKEDMNFLGCNLKVIYRFVPIDEKSSRMEVEGNVEGPRFWATLVHKGRNQFEKKFIILDDFFKNNSNV